MYAVVEYSEGHRDNHFKVIMTTDLLDYAKKLAFKFAKDVWVRETNYEVYFGDNKIIYKITSNIEREYLHLWPENRTIIEYMVVGMEKNKKYQEDNKYEVTFRASPIYSVIELEEHQTINVLEEIDDSLIHNS